MTTYQWAVGLIGDMHPGAWYDAVPFGSARDGSGTIGA